MVSLLDLPLLQPALIVQPKHPALMPLSRRCRNRSSHSLSPRKRGDFLRLSPTLRRSFRKLQYVLEDIVQEDISPAPEEDAALGVSDCEAETEGDTDGKPRVSLRAFRGPGFRKDDEEGNDNFNCFTCFKELCEHHGQLTDQIKSSLNALGGRGRTASALEWMHIAIARVASSFRVDKDKTVRFQPHDCIVSLDNYKKAVSEAMEAFRELGVFSNNFLDALEALIRQLGVAAAKLDAEYGSFHDYHVDEYLDCLFKPLIRDLKSFLVELTNIAENEIVTIRNTQGFVGQRYLNLTTVATFLSSVTATTLQITADDVGPLALVTNTLWLISLVFSTASAINSLFAITWRQSSIRRPELVLPSLVNVWFQNGPVYTLIAAVMAFAIGLSLLAFRVSDQQRTVFSSAVPTAFAGFHACVILVFSAWFLLEQWKAKTAKSWVSVRDACILSLGKAWRKHANIVKYRTRRWKLRLKWRLEQYLASFRFRRSGFVSQPSASSSSIDHGNANNIELGGHERSSVVNIASNDSENDRVLLPIPGQANLRCHTPQFFGSGSVPITRMPAMSGSSLRLFDDNQPREEHMHKPFESLLQFSSHGRLLACTYNDFITIYDVGDSFSNLATIKAPDLSRVRQISWSPGAFGDFALSSQSEPLAGELLVVSLGSISTWKIQHVECLRVQLVGQLREADGFVQWTDEENAGVKGFICANDTTVRIFNENCEQLKTIDLLDKGDINSVIAAAFYRNKYLICLADVSEVRARCDWLFVISLEDNSIKSARRTHRGHTSIIVSSEADKVLLHGSERGVWLIEMKDFSMSRMSGMDVPMRWGPGLRAPEEAVMFRGHRDKMIISYSEGEVVAHYYKRDDKYLSMLHIFTTSIDEATPRNPVSFAVNPGLESEPYMFAFRDKDGSVTIWSVQSNQQLSNCPSARTFEVHDRRGARSEEPAITTGRFLTLPPPTGSA